MAASSLFPLVNLSVEPTTGTFPRFDEKTSLYALFAGSGDQILTKIIKFDKIHVGNFQERHFLRIKKNNAENIAGGSIGV